MLYCGSCDDCDVDDRKGLVVFVKFSFLGGGGELDFEVDTNGLLFRYPRAFWLGGDLDLDFDVD